MNVAIITGRLTADAEIKMTQTGSQVINFTIANETGYGEKKQSHFLNCQYWTKTNIGNYLQKGKAVILQGEVIQQRWQDNNRKNQSRVLINVRDLQFQQGNSPNGNNQITQNNRNNINNTFNGGYDNYQQQPTQWEENPDDIAF